MPSPNQVSLVRAEAVRIRVRTGDTKTETKKNHTADESALAAGICGTNRSRTRTIKSRRRKIRTPNLQTKNTPQIADSAGKNAAVANNISSRSACGSQRSGISRARRAPRSIRQVRGTEETALAVKTSAPG